jgi:pimeloyl-ACP methyl ester carboxylesterase
MSATSLNPNQQPAGNGLSQVLVPLTATETVALSLKDVGEGHPVLLLHGGGGPLTVNGFADQFAADTSSGVRVIAPVHPGFDGTARPVSLDTVKGLAGLYVKLLEELGLHDVTVVGNSIGGWITAEMAILDSSRVGRYVIVDGVGIEVAGNAPVDFFSLSPAAVAEHAYHDPERYGIDPAKLPPAALRMMAANRETLVVYAGTAMIDPSLAARLATVTKPTLVVWGDADRIADPDYGRALAQAIPGAEFTLMRETGHLPQIETPEALIQIIRTFAGR